MGKEVIEHLWYENRGREYDSKSVYTNRVGRWAVELIKTKGV